MTLPEYAFGAMNCSGKKGKLSAKKNFTEETKKWFNWVPNKKRKGIKKLEN